MSTQDLTETERKYKDLLLSLETSYKETQDEHGIPSDLKIQLNLQRNKIVQLEKRILKLGEAEESWKNTCARLRAENDDAEARAREATLSKDMLAAQNAQLSARLAELQDVHALNAAQLDDAIYKNQQLESHISQLAKENIYWRQRAYPRAPTGAPTPGSANDPGSQSNYPPNGPHFKGPPGRRHTVPNVCLAPPAPVCGEAPTNLDRPPKRSRTDSVDSSSSSSNGFRSRAPSESATTFALRPAKPEFVDPRRFPSTAPPPSNPHYPPWHVRVPNTQIPPTYSQAAPATIPYVATGHQVLPTMQAPAVPGKPAPGMFTPAHATGLNHADAPANVPSSATAPAPTPASQVRAEPSNSARMNQFIGQLFTLSSTGHPECRACK